MGSATMTDRARRVSQTLSAVALIALAMAFSGAGVHAQTTAPPPADLAARLKKARETTQNYSHRLKRDLIEALKQGGPKAAIGACGSLAPDIDNGVSEDSGFEIGRTALKLRNPENAPDAWEKSILEQFTRQLASGSDPRTLEAYSVTQTQEGQKLFRYMSPILTQELCMSCHGTSVAQDVKAEIARTYTDDKAIGFAIGELRGAFSMVQQLD